MVTFLVSLDYLQHINRAAFIKAYKSCTMFWFFRKNFVTEYPVRSIFDAVLEHQFDSTGEITKAFNAVLCGGNSYLQSCNVIKLEDAIHELTVALLKKMHAI